MATPDLLRHALRRLNCLLRGEVERVADETGLEPGEDLLRALYVERTEALAAWDRAGRPAGAPGGDGSWATWCGEDPLFARFAREFPRFDPTDYALLLLALAPEFDPGYERVFGFLQDDVTRRRPTVGLAVDLLDRLAGGRGVVLRRLWDFSPLLAQGLVELAEPGEGRTGLFARVLRPDDQFARRLLGLWSLDRRLAPAATLTAPAAELSGLPVPQHIRRALASLLRPGGTGAPVRLYLSGRDERAKQAAAEGLARQLQTGLVTADAGLLLALGRPFPEVARVLAREGRWFGNLLFVTSADAFHAPDRHREWAQLTAALVGHTGAVVLSGTRPGLPPTPHPVGFLAVEFPAPDADDRVAHWREAGAAAGLSVRAEDAAALAERYPLTRSQIEQAVAVAAARARWRAAGGEPGPPTFDELAAAAKAQGGYELESLTHKITPRVGLGHLVLPADVRDQLTEIVGRVRRRDWVLAEWGFAARQSYGNGVNALFAGPSGTGKTMAAEAIAGELGKDLYKIDLTAVVSKYIGETEQRLEEIFRAGTATQAVLFFDEADSLLGKRSEVRDAHDRYANIEVSYLLQRMEAYDGLIVLATNLPGNLDDAFLRRMSAIVHFDPPGPAERRELWERVWPGRVPLATAPGYAIDYDFLAERFELTGGGIRNTALAAAFAAADRECYRLVTMWDVLRGVRREYQKLGQTTSDADLGLDGFRRPPDGPGEPRDAPGHEYEPAAGAGGNGAAR
jgi:hypothetical protein